MVFKQQKMIPNGWKKVKLIDVANFLDSKRVPLSSKQRENRKGEYPYYGASGIIDYIDDYLFDEDLVLLGEDGANILDRNSRLSFIARGKYWVNNHAHVLKPKDNISLYLLSEYLESLNYQKYNTGSAQPKLNRKICESIKFTIPPLPEQDRIVEVLETWDAYLEELEKKIETKKKIKKGLMQQLLTGKKRLPGFTKKWEEIKLGEIIKNVSIRNKDLKLAQVLSVTNTKGFTLPGDNFSRTIASKDLSNYKIVKKGQFAFNPSRINVGSLARLDKFENGLLSPMYVVFDVISTDLSSNFFFYWIFTARAKASVHNHSTGSVRRSLNFKGLANINTYLPLIEEQIAIAKILTTADEEIETLEKQKGKFEAQKKYLLNNLITGKIRLPKFRN